MVTSRHGQDTDLSAGQRSATKASFVAETLVFRACMGLHYHSGISGVDWLPLPEWGRFLLELGARICSTADPRKRVVASFSLPTRAYAAAFLSLGAVLARLSSPLVSATDAAHIQSLCVLAKGTPVTLCMAIVA